MGPPKEPLSSLRSSSSQEGELGWMQLLLHKRHSWKVHKGGLLATGCVQKPSSLGN